MKVIIRKNIEISLSSNNGRVISIQRVDSTKEPAHAITIRCYSESELKSMKKQ